MKKETSTGHIYYMDLMRLIACILVVLVHVSALSWEDVSVRSDEWQVMNAFDCLGIMGVPMFIMLSGALMLRRESTHSVKKILGKTLRLFLVYHVWLLFYNFVTFVKEDYVFSFYNIKEHIVLPAMRGQGIYHLWFLPVLMVLSLLTPILKKAFADKKTCEYFLILYLILGQLIPTALLFEFPYKYLLMDYYNRTSWVMLTGYIGYFVAGHYIHSFVGTLTHLRRLLTVLVVIGCYAITVIVCSIDSIQKGVPSVILNNPLTITDFIATLGIYVLIRDWCLLRNRKKAEKGVSGIAKLTFGIYLIHPFILMLIREAGITNFVPHPILMIPLLTAGVFVMSLAISWILKKIPLFGRFIV